nr:MAG TPA: hypothetical protein [Caudoviricetes sp.]
MIFRCADLTAKSKTYLKISFNGVVYIILTTSTISKKH